MVQLNDLPNELLIKVLSNLPPSDRYNFQLPLVCKRWACLTCTDIYKRSFYEHFYYQEALNVYAIENFLVWSNIYYEKTLVKIVTRYTSIAFTRTITLPYFDVYALTVMRKAGSVDLSRISFNILPLLLNSIDKNNASTAVLRVLQQVSAFLGEIKNSVALNWAMLLRLSTPTKFPIFALSSVFALESLDQMVVRSYIDQNSYKLKIEVKLKLNSELAIKTLTTVDYANNVKSVTIDSVKPSFAAFYNAIYHRVATQLWPKLPPLA